MKFEIAEEIIQETTYCKKNIICLDEKNNHLCKVSCYIKDKILFTECQEQKGCSYLESYGEINICHCPIRQEIYKRYKV